MSIGIKSDFLYDPNDGYPLTVDITINTERLRQIGFDKSLGLPKYVYMDVPSITERVTCNNVFAQAKVWEGLILEWEGSAKTLADSGVTTNEVIEDVTVNELIYLDAKDKKYMYSGSYVTSKSTSGIADVPEEFNIVETISANVQPSGFFPDGKGFFNNKFEGITYSRSSTILLGKVDEYVVGTFVNNIGFIISKSCSSLKLINNKKYVELSISYLKQLEAEITI